VLKGSLNVKREAGLSPASMTKVPYLAQYPEPQRFFPDFFETKFCTKNSKCSTLTLTVATATKLPLYRITYLTSALTMSSEELSYPNLVGCKVVMKSSSSLSSQPPEQLPKDCWDAAMISIAPLYSFSLGELLADGTDTH
jgi:hypothetical protein